VSRSSSACISLRLVRNCTFVHQQHVHALEAARNASPCPAAIAAWNDSTNSSSVSIVASPAPPLPLVPISHQQVRLAEPRPE